MKVIVKTFYILDADNKRDFNVFIANKGITKLEFCKSVGISNAMLYSLLNGNRVLTPSLESKFIKAGCDFCKMEKERLSREELK